MTGILVRVDNAAGSLVTPGPITTASGLTITRWLDKSGAFGFRVPATDDRALALIQNERWVDIMKQREAGLSHIFLGVIKKSTFAEVSGGSSRQITGMDAIAELKHIDVGRGLIYSQSSLSSVVADLVSNVSGWTATVEPAVADRVIDARFDGVKVLKALQALVKNNGLHFRLMSNRHLEVGVFGASNGLRVMKSGSITRELRNNPQVLVVDKLSVSTTSHELVNWIEGLGAGEGEAAALTLEHCTRSIANGDAYDVGVTTRNGQTVYYISNQASIDDIGLRTETVQYDDIIPLSNTYGDIVNAANALYDAIVADLDRRSVVQESYSLTVKSAKGTINPGDKIHIRYKGLVYRKGKPVNYVDINDDFWIMKVSEHHGDTNNINLTISKVDRVEESAAGILIDSISKVKSRGLRPSITSSSRSYVYNHVINPDNPVQVMIEFTDATLYNTRTRVRLKTKPFIATTTVAKEGGDHSHKMFEHVASSIWFPDESIGQVRNQFFAREADGDESTVYFILGGANTDLYTYEGSGDHTHELEYGVQKDTVTPESIHIALKSGNADAVDLTEALGGPFATSGEEIDIVLDAGVITAALNSVDVDLRQEHQLIITCEGGHGLIECTVEIFEVTQSIKVST